MRITFVYQGKEYKMDLRFGKGMGKEKIEAFVKEGAYACDCSKSRLIREHCDGSFPLLDCGNQVRLSTLDIL